MYVDMQVRVQTYIFDTYMYIQMHKHMHMHLHIFMYMHMYVYMHIHIYIKIYIDIPMFYMCACMGAFEPTAWFATSRSLTRTRTMTQGWTGPCRWPCSLHILRTKRIPNMRPHVISNYHPNTAYGP